MDAAGVAEGHAVGHQRPDVVDARGEGLGQPQGRHLGHQPGRGQPRQVGQHEDLDVRDAAGHGTGTVVDVDRQAGRQGEAGRPVGVREPGPHEASHPAAVAQVARPVPAGQEAPCRLVARQQQLLLLLVGDAEVHRRDPGRVDEDAAHPRAGVVDVLGVAGLEHRLDQGQGQRQGAPDLGGLHPAVAPHREAHPERRPARRPAVAAVEHRDREVRQHSPVDQCRHVGLTLHGRLRPQGDRLEEERDRRRGAHGVRDLLLVRVQAVAAVVPRQPDEPLARHVARGDEQRVALLRRQAASRVVDPQVAEGADAEVGQRALDPAAQVVALEDAAVEGEREAVDQPGQRTGRPADDPAVAQPPRSRATAPRPRGARAAHRPAAARRGRHRRRPRPTCRRPAGTSSPRGPSCRPPRRARRP